MVLSRTETSIVETTSPMVMAPVQEVFSSIQGEGPYVGRRQVFVRFAHCHLKCSYCDTPMNTADGLCHVETVPGSGELEKFENPMNPAILLEIITNLLTSSSHHSVSFTGGEPLLYHRFLKDLLPQLKTNFPSVQTYLETSGTQEDFLAEVLPWVDIVAMDIKIPSATHEAPRYAEHRAFYDRVKSRPETELFVKIIFNSDIDEAEIQAVKDIISDVKTPILLQPETTLDKNTELKNMPVRLKATPVDMLRVMDAFLQTHHDVRVIPQTHKLMQVL